MALEEYHEMLAGGEHTLFDIDFLHVLLKNVKQDGEWPEAFVADYHAAEYADRFDSLDGPLDWFSVCGFLTVRERSADTYHVVFPTEDLKWFMLRFIRESSRDLPFDIDIDEGVSKVLLAEQST